MTDDCTQNIDTLKLQREGLSQDGRRSAPLDPAYAPVNGRGVAHGMVFAQSYGALLKYFDANNVATGDWSKFFGNDVSVPLAVAAIEDVDAYKANTQAWFDFLNTMENQAKTAKLRDRLGYLYAGVGTLAQALDGLKESLPVGIPLKGVLQNLIRTQLAPAMRRLIAYYKAGVTLGLVNAVAPSPPVQILRKPAGSFAALLAAGLSSDWTDAGPWAAIVGDQSVYGAPATGFVQINHCSTHTLFRSIFDSFLKVFARVAGEASKSLEDTLTNWDKHDPHYALYLSFLKLFEYVRASGNTLTQRHLDFYYREILGLKEKPAAPGHVHLLAELAKQATARDFAEDELFKAGKDAGGKDAFFANIDDVVANQSKIAQLRTVYRHGSEPVTSDALAQGRIYASSIANSDDGLGAPLTSADKSWHPFFNKIYADGALTRVAMPKAEIGFAVASHHLMLAEGIRYVILNIQVGGFNGALWTEYKDLVDCFVTTEKGWLERPPESFMLVPGALQLVLLLTGADAAVVPYSAKVHGYAFATDLPMVMVKLKHGDKNAFGYSAFEGATVTGIDLTEVVYNLKTLAVSNDFGPVDTAKPFQPFGASPVAGSSLIVGSKEVFQKNLLSAWIDLDWQATPTIYPSNAALPQVAFEFLSAAQWTATGIADESISTPPFSLSTDLDKPVLDQPDFTANEYYNTKSRSGFVRLKLLNGFGQDAYQAALIKWLRKDSGATDPGSKPPVGPTATTLTMGYSASTTLTLDSASPSVYSARPGQFFHLAPFGAAERHPYLGAGAPVSLFPQLEFVRDNGTLASEAEFYIGISGLVPPQTLSVLFQVCDGTANPLAEKPAPHIDWCYLRNNLWAPFETTSVSDSTDELLSSGIVTLAIPRDATSTNTLMPSGLYWVRAAVHEKSDAVCKLLLVAAQALEAVFTDKGNAAGFSATPLPAGTIGKLAVPDAQVKSVSQPYPSFGGRGAEAAQAFYTRISERLRHKDRAIDLWDYEHLVLEAFPQIYKVKCLNHTCYEPSDSGAGIYRELAPGHVTVVTIPKLASNTLRDPLKPYTSLGVLQEVEAYLKARGNCFVKLHVRNPQFEEVRAKFSVRFYDGYDESYYTQQLQQAITRFLSPWTFSEGGTPTFGGKVYKSVLINFVEDQPYVDYVTDFQLFRDVGGAKGTADLDEVEGSKAVSILVSAPASKHDIAVLHPAADAASAETCSCDA